VVRDIRIPRSCRPIAVENDQRMMRVPTPIPTLVKPRGFALSDSEKGDAFSDSLGAPYQPVTRPSVPPVNEIFNVALRSYFLPLPTNSS